MNVLATAVIDADTTSVRTATGDLKALSAEAGRTERAADGVGGAMRRVDPHAQNMARAMEAATKHTKAMQAAGLNMGRQMSDVFVQLGSGGSLFLVALQQGPQVFDGLQVAAMQTGKTVTGVMLAMGASIWTALAPLIPLMVGVAVAAAAIAAPFAIAAQKINNDNKGLLSNFGLTKEQLKSVGGAGVTMGDVLTGTFQASSKALTAAFGPEIEAVKDFFGDLFTTVIDFAARAVRFLSGGFLGAFIAIKNTWRQLPAAIGDIAITAANVALRAVYGLINGAVDLVNGLVEKANGAAEAVGLSFRIPELSRAQVVQLTNAYAGAAREVGAGAAEGFREGFALADTITGSIRGETLAARERRLRRGATAGTGGADAAIAQVERARVALEEVERMGPRIAISLEPIGVEFVRLATPLELLILRLQEVVEMTNGAGDSLSRSFGRVGGAIGDATSLLSQYALERARITQNALAMNEAEAETIRKTRKLEIDSFADIAGVAKNAFGERTTAYKALAAVEAAYRALQFANSVRAMALDTAETGSSIGNALARGAAYAAEAVAKIFAKLGPFGFPIAAAALGVMAAVGGRVMGGGSASVPTLPSTNEGAGTVLGDPAAQSASIENSIEMAERYYRQDLQYGSATVTALRAIQSGIGAVTTAIARQIGVGGALDSSGLGLGTTTAKGFLGIGNTTRTASMVGSGLDLAGGTVAELLRGVNGSLYTLVENSKTKSGFLGFGGSTTTWLTENRTAIDNDLSQELGRLLGSLRSGVLAAAGQLGVEGAQATLDALTISLGRIDFEGLSSSEISERLNAVFSAAGDQMAAAILPQLATYQRAGEGMMETLSRLATTFQAVDTTLASIGMEFGVVGIESLAARDRLVELSGGLDAFTEGADFFAEAFLSDAQRIAPIQAAVTAELTRLGVASDISRSGFADLVLGLDVSTASGAEMFAALMRLAPALDQVISYTDDLTGAVVDAVDLSRQRRSLEIALMEAQGNSSAALAARRADELAAMDASLRPLQELIWTTNDIAEAARLATAAQEEAARAAQAIADQRRSMEITLMELTGDASGALAARRAIELSGMDASLQALQRLIYAQTDLNAVNEAAATAANEAAQAAIEREQLLAQYRAQAETDALALVEKARDALSAAYEREAGAIQTTIDKFRGFEEGLRRFRESLGLEGLSPTASLAVSKADFERTSALARVGNEQALGDLQGVSEAYLEQSRAYSKTSLDHLRNLSSVREAVQAAEATAGRQASIGEQQLAALNGSVEGLMVLNGSVLSVRDAISALASAQAVLSSVTPSVANDNREWGVNPEVNRLLARQTGYAGDFGSGGFDAWIRTQDEAVKAGARATLAAQGQAYRIGFATGGSFEVGGSGGTDSTPISFMATPGEMVNIRRPGDAASNDNSEMVAELRALRREVASLHRTNAKMERTLADVTLGGRAMQTEQAA